MQRYQPSAAFHFTHLENRQLQRPSWQPVSVVRAGRKVTGVTPPLPVPNPITSNFTTTRSKIVQNKDSHPLHTRNGSAVEVLICKESNSNHRARFWRPAVVHLCQAELVSGSCCFSKITIYLKSLLLHCHNPWKAHNSFNYHITDTVLSS